MNVLLVDDETNMQQIVGSFLDRYANERSLPMCMKALGDPMQGLYEVTINGPRYDMIILDVRMPKLSGDEIYDSISYVSPELTGRVLFITGFDDDVRERLPRRSLRVLQKPFRYQQLAAHIENIVRAD